MKTYTVVRNQMIQDIAIQLYGNLEAVCELMKLNLLLFAKVDQPDPNQWLTFDMGLMLREGQVLNYDEKSILRNNAVLAKLNKYENGNIEPICTADEFFLGDMQYILHRYTIQFLGSVSETEWQDMFSWHDVLVLDRLVRDLNGEENGAYPTHDIWNVFKAIYPMMGDTADTHKWNLVNPGAFTLAYNVSGVSHLMNGMKTDGISGYADTQIVDGIDLNNENVQAGAAWEEALVPSPNTGMFLFGSWQGDYGLGLYCNTYLPLMLQSNEIAGIINLNNHYAINTNTFYKGYAHVQNNGTDVVVYVNGTEAVSHVYLTGGGTGTHQNIWLGGINHIYYGLSFKTNRNFTFVYFGEPLVLHKQKAFWNAMNRYLWKKGVNDSFTILT